MEIVFSPKALKELEYWRKSGNVIVIERIKILLNSLLINPFEGIGKPEALKHAYRGYWSRRITSEHRLVYKVEKETIYILQLRYHY